MIWKSANGIFRVEVSSSVLEKMIKQIESARDIETGGILIGKYVMENSTALIIDAMPPPDDSVCKPCTFKRGSKGLSKLLRSLWVSKERLFYVGEWHYHPTKHVYPSQTDLDQMVSISEDPNYECKEPIMVIIGKGENERREVKCLLFPNGITTDMIEEQ